MGENKHLIMKLIPVYDINALLNVWPTIIKDVEQVLIFTTGDSTLEKIFNELCSGLLLLWIGFQQNKYCGFLTTRIYETPFKKEKERSLWITHTFIKKGFDKNIFLEGFNIIKEFGIKQKCHTIRFWSKRDKAFSKRMKPLGWQHGYQEFIYNIKQEGKNV